MIPTTTRLSYANGYLDLGMIEDARRELDAISKQDRLLDDVLGLRARLYMESHCWELMEAVAKQLVGQAPQLAFAWVHWAYALRELERNEEAKQIALRALKRHPEEAILWFNLACYCSLLGEVQEAEKHLEQACELEEAFRSSAQADPDLANLFRWKQEMRGN